MPENQFDFLVLKGLTKRFGDFTALSDVNINISDGEFFTLVGPSGSGKTTLIRILVGMDSPTSGEIFLKGNTINGVPANKRPTCMVFQNLALFPHKTVGQNVEFAMKIAGVDSETRRKKGEQLLELLRLQPREFYSKSINQCSGGERQRIALARALAFDPEILFFDEPLSALDYRLRKTLEKELKDIHRETGKTFVYITHSLEEAMVMSDRIGILNKGELIQIGSPDDIYNRPINKFVAQFMGEVNTFEVKRESADSVTDISLNTQFQIAPEYQDFTNGFLIVRPEVMKIGESAQSLPNRLHGVLFNDYALGSRVQYQVRSDKGNHHWLIERLQDDPYSGAAGDRVTIGWRTEDSILVNR